MPENPQFLGPMHPQDVAERINQSVGPSGENRDYLLHLEQSLQDLSAQSTDSHISDLAKRVRSMEPRSIHGKPDVGNRLPLQKVSSTEEQEEIEKEV